MAVPLLLSLAPAAIGTYMGAQENKKIAGIARRNARKGEIGADAARTAIRNMDFSPAQAVADAVQNRKGYGERINVESQRRGDEVNARTIAALGENERLLRAAGPRAYEAGLQHALEGELKGVDIKTQADMFMADAAQKGLDQKRGVDLQMNQFDLQQGTAAFNAGRQAELAAQAALGEAYASGGVAITEALLGMPGQRSAPGEDPAPGVVATVDDTVDDGPNYGAMRFKSRFQNAPADIRPGTVDMGGAEGYMQGERYNLGEMFGAPNPEYGYGDPLGIYYNEDLGDVDDFQNQSGVLPYGGYQFEQGGYIAEGGGVTKGEFSHDTNKKAIIDEENGQKEGELTGGEVVFNPEQTDKIEDFIEERDADGLMQYMTMLFSLPQFQEA
jgi:hypothetical protein